MEFVRTLALALVNDESVADDVTQETLMDALRQPPQIERGLRSWFSGVVRNKIRLHYRGEGRRRRWERKAGEEREMRARNQSLAEDALQRAELRQEVVQSVIDLPEPYRLTLILRYLEDLTPTEIAEWTGEPLSTIKTRLQRGLDRVRQRLDEEHGDRKSWKKAVILLASPDALRPAALTAAASGTAVMSFSVGWILSAIVLVVAGWFAVSTWNGAPLESSNAIAKTTAGERKRSTPPVGGAVGSSPEPTVAASAATEVSESGLTVPAAASVELTVVDSAGNPIEGAVVGFKGRSVEQISDRDGRVPIDHDGSTPALIEVRHPDYVSQATLLGGEGPFLITLVEGEPVLIRVIDAGDGRPVPNATVEVCSQCQTIEPEENESADDTPEVADSTGVDELLPRLFLESFQESGAEWSGGSGVAAVTDQEIRELVDSLPEGDPAREKLQALLSEAVPISGLGDFANGQGEGAVSEMDIASSFTTVKTDENGEAWFRVASLASSYAWIRAPGYAEAESALDTEDTPKSREGEFTFELIPGSRLIVERGRFGKDGPISILLQGPVHRSARLEAEDTELVFQSLRPGFYRVVAVDGDGSDYAHSPYVCNGTQDWVRRRQRSARGTDLLEDLAGRIRSRTVEIQKKGEHRLSLGEGKDVRVRLVGLEPQTDIRPTVALYESGQLVSVGVWSGAELWLESIEPGDYQLEVRDRGALLRSRGTSIAASTQEIEVDVRGASLAIAADSFLQERTNDQGEIARERIAVVSTTAGTLTGIERNPGEELEIEGLEPGPVEVWRLRGRAYFRTQMRLHVGANQLSVSTESDSRSVRLVVRDERGQPSDAAVWLVPEIGSRSKDPERAIEVWLSHTRPQSKLVSSQHEWRLPPGRYHVGVETSGHLSHHQEIKVTRDETFEVQIPPVQSLTIRVHRRGQPVAASDLCVARIDVPPLAGIQPCVHVRTDAAGLASLELPRGQYAIQLPHHEPARLDLDLETTTFEIDIENYPTPRERQ